MLEGLERAGGIHGDILIGGTILLVVVMIPIAIALYLLKSIEAVVLAAFGVVPVVLWWVLSNLEGQKNPGPHRGSVRRRGGQGI